MQYKSIEDFYLHLPEEILQRAFELDYNSKIKKAIDSVKNNSTKLKKIMADRISRRKFIDFLYQEYNVAEKDYKSITDVLAMVDKDNIIESIIYVIHEYLDDNKLNMNFNLIANKVDELQKSNINDDNKVLKDNVLQLKNKLSDNNSSENGIKSIVVLKREREFFNIYPLAELQDNYIRTIEKSERQEKYPSYGNINVYVSYNSNLRNIDIDEEELKVFKFSKEDLNDTGLGSRYQIDEKYILDKNNFYSIEKDNIFEVIELMEDSKRIEYKFKNKIPIISNYYSKNDLYINNEEFIYGPFKTKDIGRGYELILSRNDYIINKYSINKNNIILGKIQNINYNESTKNIIWFKNNNIIKEEIDIISDKELIELLKEKIIELKPLYSKEEIQKFRENIYSIIDNRISNSRIERIRNMISQTEVTEEFISNELINIIGDLLEIDKEKKRLVEKILNNNENLRKLQNYSIVEDKVKAKEYKLELLEKNIDDKNIELNDLKIQIKDKRKELQEKNIDALITQNNEKIQHLEEEKKKLQLEISDLKQKYNLINNYIEIEEKVRQATRRAEEAEDEYQVFRKRADEWNNKIKELEEKFKRKLKEATSDCDSIAFDLSFQGLIANEMMKKAAEWGKKVSDDEFSKCIMKQSDIKKIVKIKEKTDVINYIYEKIKSKRNYSRNEIINIMMCISQGFLTIFAGEPGVGKTSICNIIADSIGLINNGVSDRYVEVSVEKGWTSKRDFIGYYNPLTKEFDKSNNLLFKSFNILDNEYKNGINDVPFYILLDEANLSPMEHYWADFMNVCDLNKDNRSISLGDGYAYNIPDTLRFLATINYDHTTENLSPRLIDRAWIIILDNNIIDIIHECKNIKEENSVILFEDIKNVFSYDSAKLNNSLDRIDTVLYQIYNLFRENNISISPRIQEMINQYLSVGYDLFEKTEITAKEFVALDYAISQKLLPKIDGYGEDYRKFLNNLEEIFDDNNMMKSKGITKRILDKGDKNMEYYQFFL
mgnify:CR=1 FL=1